ncbi:gamma-glutamylcyclotransferase [Pseudooceanicola sp. 216_PA32_1]|uniref:Gamma-glutamylcyclotransferase n=1 Tax=Pseudooceanicola pacificus TaxID=2676438 RepID=A0A844W8R2_9RHOB|nr:gamma-glutamylcyclotransferase family protein [Pseudooceanicola pacificus]MWB79234.1 gamma-glutamylcyclotransferase [Pseudooceanicola pacificus]
MIAPCFFGYGSLVNRATHSYPDAVPATARGWRRLWRHTAGRRTAILTAVPCPGCDIQGLVASVPGADWAALDRREAAYDRVDATADVVHGRGKAEVAIYTIPADKHPAADAPGLILLSYLDVVVQGYMAEFGTEGVLNFFATTDGWDAPVLNDRGNPVYPRHQILTAEERGLTDAALAERGARIVTD